MHCTGMLFAARVGGSDGSLLLAVGPGVASTGAEGDIDLLKCVGEVVDGAGNLQGTSEHHNHRRSTPGVGGGEGWVPNDIRGFVVPAV